MKMLCFCVTLSGKLCTTVKFFFFLPLIWGSQGSDYDDCCLLECDAV